MTEMSRPAISARLSAAWAAVRGETRQAPDLALRSPVPAPAAVEAEHHAGDVYEILARGWADEHVDEEYLALGHIYYDLLTTFRDWIQRRVERVSVVGERRFLRQVSVMFRLPAYHVAYVRDVLRAPTLPLPLSLLAKKPLMSFDLRDAEGRSLPLLTRMENGAAATAALYAAADRLDRPLTPGLRDLLRAVATTDKPHAVAALEALGITPDQTDEHEDPIVQTTRWLVQALDENFILFADFGSLERLAGSQIAKFLAEQPHPGTEKKTKLRTHLGYMAAEFAFDTPSVPHSASYHFEFVVPDGLVTVGGTLYTAERGQTTPKDSFGEQDHSESVIGIVGGSDPPVADTYNAQVLLVPAVEGPVRTCAITAVVTTVVLYAALLYCREFGATDDTDAAVALLLLLPSIAAAAVVRQGEHAFVSEMLRWIRRLALLSCCLPFLAALGLVIGVDDDALFRSWAVLTTAAFCLAVAVGKSAWARFVALPG